MSQTILSYEDFIGRVGDFAKQAPVLLGRHASTADLASRVDGVAEQGERPFTVAVVGQMRVGKSTLLNALMERDLAITGVNETTATLNWFRHGSREQEGFFRVIWKDLPAEDFRFDEIGEWVGDSQKAARTAAIEFFVDSPYLRIANLVDTPGSRSAIGSHEETINRFLSGKLEEETNKQAQRADAIIYVFGAVGHENDETLLQQFESSTRIQGSSPFNSVAVLHKWDSLNVADPRKDAGRKAAGLLERMSSHVSDVIPVSAPLFQAVTKFDDRFWESVSRMANETDEDDMEDLLMGPAEFVEDAASCPLDVAERKSLRATYQLPWETLTLLFKICACDGCKTGADLRQSALKSSGIPELRGFLDLRFFNRSRAIKSFSLLAKLVEPCEIAQLRLRKAVREAQGRESSLHDAIDVLTEAVNKGMFQFHPVLDLMASLKKLNQREVAVVTGALGDLGSSLSGVKSSYEDLQADLKALDSLEEPTATLAPDFKKMLQSLLGMHGPDVESRVRGIGPEGSMPSLQDIERLIGRIRSEIPSTLGKMKTVLQHALIRAEQVWDEQNKHAAETLPT